MNYMQIKNYENYMLRKLLTDIDISVRLRITYVELVFCIIVTFYV